MLNLCRNSISLLLLFLLTDCFTANCQPVFYKHSEPVLQRSAVFPDWKGLATADPFVLQDGDTLKMWFSGSGWLTASDDCPHVRIGYAWSLDGIHWNEYSQNPVLNIGSDSTDFDYDGVETASVVLDPKAAADKRFKMWYAGRNSRCSTVNDHAIGYAYSPDGIHWTKYSGNPVLRAEDSVYWYNSFVSGPSVLQVQEGYKMWFTAPDLFINGQPSDGKSNIAVARSTDGILWLSNPAAALTAGDQSSSDAASAAEPSIHFANGLYHMFYSSLANWTVENFQVNYAFSTDGLTWVKSEEPVLTVGRAGEWDSYWASHPTVIYDSVQKKYRIWYTGRDQQQISSLEGYHWDIGYAESSTMISIDSANIKPVKVYPNPASTEVFFSFSVRPQSASMLIYDSFGRIVDSVASMSDQLYRLDCSRYPAGLYFFYIRNSQQVLGGRFIITGK